MSSFNAFNFAAQSAGVDELRVIGVCDGYDFQPTLPSSYMLCLLTWNEGWIYLQLTALQALNAL
jgi:hypothetical protein